jgi:8-oxo-dGTP pyrophosphatase MutT (NUDIX family)
LGKTTLIQALLQEELFKGYTFDEEPVASTDEQNLDIWYTAAHVRRINDRANLIYERSLLSTVAFLYAQDPEGEAYKAASEELQKHKDFFWGCVIVYLSADPSWYMQNKMVLHESPNARHSLDWFSRYHEFYTKILPLKFDIAAFEIPVLDQSGLQKPVSQVLTELKLMLEHDRRAQANVVPMDREGRILVLKRNERKGGFWQTVTGGVHITGSLSENALREVGEELSIVPIKENLVFTGDSFAYVGGEGYWLREYVMGYKLDPADTIILSDEHVASELLPTEEAAAKVKWDGNKDAIRLVSSQIK